MGDADHPLHGGRLHLHSHGIRDTGAAGADLAEAECVGNPGLVGWGGHDGGYCVPGVGILVSPVENYIQITKH